MPVVVRLVTENDLRTSARRTASASSSRASKSSAPLETHSARHDARSLGCAGRVWHGASSTFEHFWPTRRSAHSRRETSSVGTISKRRRSITNDDADSQFAPTVFVDTVRMCEHQKNQLLVSRTSQMGTVHLRCRRDVGTAFYGVLRRHPTLYACIIIYACVACASRVGALPADAADAATTGMGTLVSFTVVFFFGYAYERSRIQHGNCISAVGGIINFFEVLRPALDHETLTLLWCLVNCAHVCGYTSLQTVYTNINLFDPFCHEHGLFDKVANARAIRRRIDDLRIDTSSNAVREIVFWILTVLRTEHTNWRINHCEYRLAQQSILQMRGAVATLSDYTTQVIPYMYLHLTGAMSAAYLVAVAVQKAVLFDPESDALFGLALPFATFLAIAFSLLGLLELGGDFMNPLGGDDTDLPVLDMLTFAVDASRAIVDAPTMSFDLKPREPQADAQTVLPQERATKGAQGASI